VLPARADGSRPTAQSDGEFEPPFLAFRWLGEQASVWRLSKENDDKSEDQDQKSQRHCPRAGPMIEVLAELPAEALTVPS
jgi:hypothetical protein